MKRFGLTLIELLLVIGIIAVLAGIIWAVFAPVREKVRQVQCMNNLKQIHFALMMYRQDYNAQAFPVKGAALAPADLGLPCLPVRYPPSLPAIFLPDQLAPYLKDRSVFVCPNDQGLSRQLIPPESMPPPDVLLESYVRIFPVFGCRYEEMEDIPKSNHNWWLMDMFRRSTEACGEQLPLLYCQFHGYIQKRDSYLIIMRWNGRVEGRYVWLPLIKNLCLE